MTARPAKLGSVPSPDELRALAASLETRAAELRRLADETERALKGLSIVTDDRTMANMHPTTDPNDPRAHRPGVKITSTGPYAQAALNAGVSLRELADKIGLKYSTLKMRDRNGYGDAAVRKLLAKAPYNVPASAWPAE